MAQPGVRLLVVGLGGFDQAVDLRAGGRTFWFIAKQPVLTARAARLSMDFRVTVGMAVASHPRTDPYVRNYRIRLLPWVLTPKRVMGYGCIGGSRG